MLILSNILFANTYSEKDWEIYKSCKNRVYKKIYNDFNYEACQLMLKDKENLKIYGAERMYDNYIKELYYFN